METSDVLGVGGPALHPHLQWDGPARGIVTKVSAGVCAAGVFEVPESTCVLAFHCPAPGDTCTVFVIIGLYLYYDSLPAHGSDMCLISIVTMT